MAVFSRRQVLTGLSASFAVGLSGVTARAASSGEPLFASAIIDGDRHGVALLGRDGALIHRIELPGRGHDITVDPTGRILVAFARRPGSFALVIDRLRGERLHLIQARPDRHFYGHGVFTADGRLLLATENDFEAGRGVLGVYDATDDYRRIGEWKTHGIGPHDLALLPDGQTLVVANGGMDTHPDYGREVLNLANMEPSIVFLDASDGALIERHELPRAWSRQSTRHMDFLPNGQIYIGCQWQGALADCPPLLMRVAKGEALKPVSIGDDLNRALNGYVGSVAANAREGLVAITSPRGRISIVVDDNSGEVVASKMDEADVCGVAGRNDGFVTSNGSGRFAGTTHPGVIFDNHITPL